MLDQGHMVYILCIFSSHKPGSIIIVLMHNLRQDLICFPKKEAIALFLIKAEEHTNLEARGGKVS